MSETHYLSLQNMASDPDQMFLYSCLETNGLNERNPNALFETHEFDHLDSLLDYEHKCLPKLKRDYIGSLENKHHNIGKDLMQVKNDFYHRNVLQYNLNLDDQAKNQTKLHVNFDPMHNLFTAIQEPQFEGIPGCNPKKWPEGLDEFLEKIESLSKIAFFYEPLEFKSDFFQHAQIFLEETSKNIQEFPDSFQDLLKATKSYMLVCLKTGNFNMILNALNLVNKIAEKLPEKLQETYYQLVQEEMSSCLRTVKAEYGSQAFHYARSLNNMGGFNVFKMSFFGKQTFQNSSLATDGAYLYLYVAAQNGGLYKIGTGENGTTAGKVKILNQIYLFKSTNKHEDVSWTYCNNTLYLRLSSSPFGTLDKICPVTFNSLGDLQLYCPDIFAQPSLQLINKNYPLMSDGEFVYIIGKKINTQKVPCEKKDKQTESVVKICDFILYEFDVSQIRVKRDSIEDSQDHELVKELFDSFCGFFSMSECSRALSFNKDDIQSAATWLTDEGERERLKQTVVARQETLLAQSEIISDTSQKYLKSNVEIQARENSILFPSNTTQNIWTMNKEQITLYSEHGIKVFSKNPDDLRPLKLSQIKVQFSQTSRGLNTRAKKNLIEEKFMKNNEEAKLLEEFIKFDPKYFSSKQHSMLIQEDYDKLHLKIQMLVKMTSEAMEKGHPEEPEEPKPPVSNEPYHNLILKGTHLKTIELNPMERHCLANPLSQLVYGGDRFYSFQWSTTGSHHNLPSSITMGYDPNSYNASQITEFIGQNQEENINLSINTDPQSNFWEKTLQILLDLQEMRYKLPYRINHWYYLYGMALAQHQQTKNQIDETTSKQFYSLRQKLLKRLKKVKKINQSEKIELRYQYAFNLKGDSETLQLLLQQLNLKKNETIHNLYLRLWCLFLTHSDQTLEKVPIQLNMEPHPYSLIDSLSFLDNLPEQLEKIIMNFDIKYFNERWLNNNDYYYYKDSQIINRALELTLDNNQDYIKTFQKYQTISHPKIDIQLGKLLIHNFAEQNTNKLFDLFEQELALGLKRPQIEDLFYLFTSLVDYSSKELERIENLEHQIKQKKKFIQRIADILEKVLKKMKIENENLAEVSIQKILQNIYSLIFTIAYLNSNLQNSEVALTQTFITIFNSMHKLLDLSGNKQELFLNFFNLLPNQGIDIQNERVFETNHPYERSKTKNFDSITYPGAIGVAVEFDRRCQSDTAHDYFTITGYYDSHQVNSNVELPLNIGIGNTFKVSGKPNVKRQVILLGNVVEAEFTSSAHSRDEHSLSRWGYKVTIRPIYGVNIPKNQHLSEFAQKFGSDTQFNLYLLSQRTLLSSILETTERELKSLAITQEEKSLNSILHWSIFKKGLSDQTPQNYVCKKNHSYEMLKESNQIISETASISSAKQKLIKNDSKPKKQYSRPQLPPQFEGLQNLPDLASLSPQYARLLPAIKNHLSKYGPQLNTYILLKKRPTFTPFIQLWDYLLELLPIICLHHLSLIPNSQQDLSYLEEHFKHIKELNIMVLNHMIYEVQNRVEFQFIVSDILENGGDYAQFKTQYENSQRLEGICELRQVQGEEMQIKLHNLFDDAKEEAKRQKAQNLQQSPYETVANLMINKCLFLLRVNPFLIPEKPQQDTQEDLQPLGISRTMSVTPEEKVKNPQKLSMLRNFLDSFSQWKQMKDKQNISDLGNRNTSPLKSIYAFLTSNVNYKELESSMVKQCERASLRLIGFQKLNQLIQLLKNTIYEKNVIGVIQGIFKKDINENITCAPKSFRLLFQDSQMQILKYMMESFNVRFAKVHKVLSLKKQMIKSLLQMDQSNKEYFKVFYTQINEISILINSYHQNIWNVKEFQALFTPGNLVYQFFQNVFNLALYVHSFLNLSYENIDICQISQNIIQSVQMLTFKTIEKISFVQNEEPLKNLLHMISHLLSLEIGYQHPSLQIRLLTRLKDLITQNRLCFLIKTLLDFYLLLNCNQHLKLAQPSILNPLLLLAYFSDCPLVIRWIFKFLKPIYHLIKFEDLLQLDQLEFVFYKINNLEEILKQKQIAYPIQAQLIRLEMDKNTTHHFDFSLKNILYEKIGGILQYKEPEIQRIIHEANEKSQQSLGDLLKKNGTSKYQAVLVHLLNEEDVQYLFRALFYWEDLYPSFSQKYPQTIEEYQSYKEKQKEQGKANGQSVSQGQQKVYERIFTNFPEYNFLNPCEEQLPIGWQFCYLDLWPDMSLNKQDQRSTKVKKIVKKVWANHTINKIFKKFEDLDKSFEEFKELDSEEDKLQNIQARFFIKRVLHHIKEVQHIASILNVFGYSCCFQSTNEKKVKEYSNILNLAIQNELKPISLEKFKEDYRKKLDIQSLIETKKEVRSMMIVSICDSKFYQNFNYTVDYVTSLATNKDNFQNDCNKLQIIHRSCKTGYSQQSVLQECIEFLRHFPLTASNSQSLSLLPQYPDLTQYDQLTIIGNICVMGGWVQTIRTGGLVKIKDQNEQGVVVNAGKISGKSQNMTLNMYNDLNLNLQTIDTSMIKPIYQKQQDLSQIDPILIVETLIYLLSSIEKQPQLSLVLYPVMQMTQFIEHFPQHLIQPLISHVQPYMSKTSSFSSESACLQTLQHIWSQTQDSLDSQSKVFQLTQTKYDQNYPFQKALQNKKSEHLIETTYPDISPVLQPSSYLQDLQSNQKPVTENKLLKYWEKHVIPRIQDFVRSSYSQWEFDDFFEQMRTPLRKGDQQKATEIAYIMCDKRLPTGVVLPEMNHDWSTLSLDEIRIGMHVTVKLHKIQNAYLYQYKKRDQEVLGQVIASDGKNNSVLVLVKEVETGQMFGVWAHVHQVKLPSISLTHQQNHLETVIKDWLGFSVCKMLVRGWLSGAQGIDINLIDMLKWSVLEEYKSDPLQGFFMDYQGNTWLDKYKEHIHKLVFQQRESKFRSELIENFKSKFNGLIQKINEGQVQIDLAKLTKEKSTDDPTNLTDLLKTSHHLSSVIIEFDQQATLTHCGGLNFFSDPQSLSLLKTMYADSESKKNLIPLIFHQKKLYGYYFYNAEALPPYAQNPNGSKLPAVIYGIPSEWAVLGYLIEILTDQNMDQEIIQILFNIVKEGFLNLENGYIFKEVLVKLMNRMYRKYKGLFKQDIEVSIEFKDDLVNQICILMDGNEGQLLCSSYISLMMEFAANLIERDQTYNLQNHDLKSFLNIIQIISFLKNEGEITENIVQNCLEPMNLDYQWDNLICLKNLPSEMTIDSVKNLLLPILEKNKARIYLPNDLYLTNNSLLIIMDGWRVLTPEETLIDTNEEEKESEPEEQPEPVVEEPLTIWICSACTFENNDMADACEICTTPRPPPQVIQPVVQEKPQTNLDQLQLKAKQKEQEAFQVINEEISNIFDDVEFYQGKDVVNNCKSVLESALKQRQQEKADKIKEIILSVKAKFKKADRLKDFNQKYSLRVQYFDSEETFLGQFDSFTGEQVFRFLQYNGYDFYLQQSAFGFEQKVTRPDINIATQLINYIWHDICQETKEIVKFSSEKIRFTLNRTDYVNYENDDLHYQKYAQMFDQPLYVIRFTWSLLKHFNLCLSNCLSMIDMKKDSHAEFNLSLSCSLSNLRELWMTPIKLEFAQKVLQKTALPREHTPKITIERLKIIKDQKNLGMTQKNKEDFIFTQSYEQLKDVPSYLLRPVQPLGADPMICFEVIFKGENVQGEAGPYRQFFSDISNELQPSSNQRNCNLLMPTPNQKNVIGDGRDLYLFNSECESPYQIKLFEYLGFLMGCCIRTNTHLSLDLPQLTWKQIQEQQVGLRDFLKVDKLLCDLVTFIENCDKDTFDSCEIENYTTTLANNKTVELIQDGYKKPVRFEDRFDYVKKLLQARQEEGALQISAVRRGLLTQIPKAFLNSFSSEDLEILITGKPDVNFELLRRHTVYSGNLQEDSDLVQNFWKALKSFKPNEKLKFVKFCWGQERLPAYDEEFEMQQIRFMIKPANYSSKNIDKAFPRSDTCFFNLELPNYSTYEILRDQLLKVIYTDCDSMNADQQIQLDPNAQENQYYFLSSGDDYSDYYEDIPDDEEIGYEEEEEE